jgi:hypothetical protein
MEETTLIASIFTFLGIATVQAFTFLRQKLYLNKKFDTQEKKNEDIDKKLSGIDKLQNDRITALENEKIDNDKILSELQEIKKDITFLKDLHKYTYLLKELETKIGKTADSILILKEFKNKEIKEALKLGQKKSLEIFDLILNYDFEIDKIKLQEEILLALKTIKISIDSKKLCLKEPESFMKSLEEKLRNITDWFILEFQDIAKKLNGERRKSFENLCLQMIKNIYNETIDLYKKYSE